MFISSLQVFKKIQIIITRVLKISSRIYLIKIESKEFLFNLIWVNSSVEDFLISKIVDFGEWV